MYFGRPAHDAICEFQKAQTEEERHEIYVTRIKQPFNKLVENLIFIHGFKSLTGSYVIRLFLSPIREANYLVSIIFFVCILLLLFKLIK